MTTARLRRLVLQALPARDGARSRPVWPWALATATLLGLLLALGLVVQDVVHQAAARHADAAARSTALWRCNTVAGRDARQACRNAAGAAVAGRAR